MHNDGVECDNNSNKFTSASINHSGNRIRMKSKKQKRRKKKTTNNRLSWVLCLGAIGYVILIYLSIELADQVWNTEVSLHENQTPLEELQTMDAKTRTARYGRLPNGKLRQKKQLERTNQGVGAIFARLGSFMNNGNDNKPWKNKEGRARHPTLMPKHMAPETLLLPKPIINVGFPKAGTSTIFSFFHCNGLKAQHWYCCEEQKHPSHSKSNKLMSACMLRNMAANRPIFDNCGTYDVYSEINGPRQLKDGLSKLDDGSLYESTVPRMFFPQHHYLNKIHTQHPNATLILNKRDTSAWIKSVLSWNVELQYQIINEFYEQNTTRFLFQNAANNNVGKDEDPTFQNKTHNNNVNNEDEDETVMQAGSKKRKRKRHSSSLFSDSNNRRRFLKALYEYHIDFVRDWVALYPSHALVEVSIADEDAGEKLAKAFGLEEDCWGHFNQKTGAARPKRGNVAKKSDLREGGRMRISGEPLESDPPS